MSLLIETIKLLDGRLFNLTGHEERMNRSLSALLSAAPVWDLEQFILQHKPPVGGLYKCRIIYDATTRQVGFTPYEQRSVKRIKVVEDDDISYSCKFVERGPIDRLFALRGDCDDVLIIRKGKVTDCSYSNVVFRKGDEWYTPDAPLLEGTMRAKLIRENKVRVAEIRKEDIRSFDSLKMINAMLEFSSPEIDVSEIVF